MVTIYDYTGFMPEGEVERILSFACDYLGISDVTVVISPNEKMLKRLSPPDTDFYAALFKNRGVDHIYTLYTVKKLTRNTYMEILCHEAVHLSQQEHGDLRVDISTGKCYWMNEEYTKDYPYMSRPWEKEAFKVQSVILKKYRKSIKKIKP